MKEVNIRMLNSFLISSGCLPLIMLATVLHPTSLQTRTSATSSDEREKRGKIHIQEGFYIKVIGGEDDFEQHLLVDLYELLIPV